MKLIKALFPICLLAVGTACSNRSEVKALQTEVSELKAQVSTLKAKNAALTALGDAAVKDVEPFLNDAEKFYSGKADGEKRHQIAMARISMEGAKECFQVNGPAPSK